jgi:hypothetical protein
MDLQFEHRKHYAGGSTNYVGFLKLERNSD